MEKKSKIIVILIVIVLFIGLGLFYTQFYNREVQIGELTFSLPEGYHKGGNASHLNISNGSDTFLIEKYDDNNINKYINGYKNYKIKDFNETVNVTTFKTKNMTIYKSTLSKDKKTIHYWFNYKNKTYTFYTWDGDKNSDETLTKIVDSIK